MPARSVFIAAWLGAAMGIARADLLQLPTANDALFKPGAEEAFFVGTVGKPWTSGCFGCVRSEGWQMHEGLDIRCVERDRKGEPSDPVMATAGGTVVYMNKKPALSNYGIYLVLRHRLQDIELYSIYAHLKEIRPQLETGQEVQAGEVVATMGRTSNTRQAISRERAHLHFELNLLVNDRFAAWFKRRSPGERNDHGNWNGQNMLGLDPRLLLIATHEQGDKFSLPEFVRGQTELCRVVVRKTAFPWVHRYGGFIRPNPVADKEGVAGYELALNYNGVPFELIPRAASEIRAKGKYVLLSVNEAEYRRHPCRRLVTRNGSHWHLGTRAVNLLDLLTY